MTRIKRNPLSQDQLESFKRVILWNHRGTRYLDHPCAFYRVNDNHVMMSHTPRYRESPKNQRICDVTQNLYIEPTEQDIQTVKDIYPEIQGIHTVNLFDFDKHQYKTAELDKHADILDAFSCSGRLHLITWYLNDNKQEILDSWKSLTQDQKNHVANYLKSVTRMSYLSLKTILALPSEQTAFIDPAYQDLGIRTYMLRIHTPSGLDKDYSEDYVLSMPCFHTKITLVTVAACGPSTFDLVDKMLKLGKLNKSTRLVLMTRKDKTPESILDFCTCRLKEISEKYDLLDPGIIENPRLCEML